MDHLRALLTFLVLSLLSLGAWASFPATTGTPAWTVTNWTSTGPTYGDQQTACVTGGPNAYYAAGGICPNATATWSGGVCTLNKPQCGTQSLSIVNVAGYTCPSNSTLSGSSCTCNSGFTENGTHNGCIADAAAYCIGLGGTRLYGTWGMPVGSIDAVGTQGTFCNGNLGPSASYKCEVRGLISQTGSVVGGGAVLGWTTGASYTGNMCDTVNASPAPEPSAAGTPCNDPASCPPPVGKCPGTVNGVAVWVPCSSGASTTSTSTTDGNGTTTQDKKTTCDNGSCSTTTTTGTTPNGGTTTTTTTTSSSSKTVYCASNSTDPLCGGTGDNKSTFGGSCSAGFACSGDAAQCAAAKATWLTHCDLSGDTVPAAIQQTYDQARSQYASDVAAGKSGTGMQSETVTISSSSFDQTDALSNGGCLADRPITFVIANQPKTVVIPFSKVCEVAALLGNLLIAGAFVIATGIVLNGLKGV